MVWYTDEQLMSMLRKWRMIYLKPDMGSGGTGVIRVKRRGDAECAVSWGHHSLRCHLSELPLVLRSGPLSIDWTARIEKITQLDRTFVRIERA